MRRYGALGVEKNDPYWLCPRSGNREGQGKLQTGGDIEEDNGDDVSLGSGPQEKDLNGSSVFQRLRKHRVGSVEGRQGG